MKFETFNRQIIETELDSFEKEFNFNLPESYRKVILAYNGGVPEKPYYDGGRVLFIPIKYGDLTVETTLELLKDVLLKNFMPFAEGGDLHYCISFEEDTYGKIYILLENGEIEEIADSFEDFLNELSTIEDY